MILIYDERNGGRVRTDIRILHKQTIGCIKKLRKDLDAAECLPMMQTETLNCIAFHRDELQDLTEMQKVPFDVLIVIQQESHMDCSDIDMTKRAMRE